MAVSSWPPVARASARTTPVTATEVSRVSPATRAQVASGTSRFENTACRYPEPSRRTTKAIFPLDRVVVTQPRTVTDSPT